MLRTTPSSVPYTTQDRQWDGRFNVQTDESLQRLLAGLKREWDAGKFRYILCSGVEIGTRPYQDDYQVRHVHVAAVYNNRVSKSSILKNWDVTPGNGYYLVPRNRDLPFSGWKNHHVKAFSKVNPTSLVLYEMGTLPEDPKDKRFAKSSEEEKKRKIDDILIDMRGLIDQGKEDEAFTKFPRTYLQYGEKLKAMVCQRRDFLRSDGHPHIWLFGYPGTGKSAVLNFIYPTYYKKNLHNKFFDLYDPKTHTHVMLEDLDHEAVQRLSLNFIKTICDEAGFAIDQKYKTPQLARTTVLITSNFEISNLVEDGPGVEETKAALYRRFWHINVYNLLRVVGLKLLPKADRQLLQQEGNQDPSKIFLAWDYTRDSPTGDALKDPTFYQKLIKDAYYGVSA